MGLLTENDRISNPKTTSLILTGSGLQASKALVSLLDPTVPPTVRHGAARSILELGLKLRENAELEERMAALEARAALADQGSVNHRS